MTTRSSGRGSRQGGALPVALVTSPSHTDPKGDLLSRRADSRTASWPCDRRNCAVQGDDVCKTRIALGCMGSNHSTTSQPWRVIKAQSEVFFTEVAFARGALALSGKG